MLEKLKVTTFPQGNLATPKNPAELYSEIYQMGQNQKRRVYGSCALTSGGAKRHSAGAENPDNDPHIWYQKLEIPDLIRINGEFVEDVFELLEASDELSSDTDEVTLPHLIGPQFLVDKEAVRGWKEIEYLCFWSMVITGMKPEAAVKFYEELLNYAGINWQVFNNYAAERADRIVEYKALEEFVVQFVNNLEPDLKNLISMIIMLPDSHLSLGATFEQRIAQALGINLAEIEIDIFSEEIRNHPLWEDPVFRWLIFEAQIFLRPETRTGESAKLARLRPVTRKLEYGVVNPDAMTVLATLNEK